MPTLWILPVQGPSSPTDEEDDEEEGSDPEPPTKRSRVTGSSKSTASSSKKTSKAQDKSSPHRSPRKNPCPPSVAKYEEGFKALEAAIGCGDIGIINAYTGIEHFYRRLTAPPATVVPKGKGTKSKKVVKSSAIVQDDDEEEVQVITSKETSGGDVEMASGLEVSIHAPPKVNFKEAKFHRIASSSQTARSSSNRAVMVSIPFHEVPGMDISSRVFHKANAVLQKNHEIAKRMRIAGSASDFSEPKPGQEKQLEKEIGQIFVEMNMLPFVNFADLPTETLNAVRNHLSQEILSVRHQMIFLRNDHQSLTNSYAETVRAGVGRISIGEGEGSFIQTTDPLTEIEINHGSSYAASAPPN
ncbi:hypothetical protein K435DRAFT_867852 [Dendrothele bispora CBS 962.96]|uniref:Uncharacterized protein n=1 Tax=Dendrothele bispora (strain CBS 962.96) TaxID=1314807 RepID=A0A4S8LDP3_DENBC|nr:hypothetical protein K435DRAFT_867852 [Dendrothele bispora CBS 962.96]